jgi:hypothetical protein
MPIPHRPAAAVSAVLALAHFGAFSDSIQLKLRQLAKHKNL